MSVPAHMAEQVASPQKQDNIWERQQQKAFTAWCNSHLRQRSHKVTDVAVDFSDGLMLCQLMEIVGNVTLPKAAKGKMRIHKIQNLNHALAFIKEKGVKLVGIGAEEIADGILKLILGMIWTIILRFDIADLSVEESSGKDALLLWAQRKTASYDNVNVTNFHKSWKDGLAFCALIHKHRPDLIDYDSLSKATPRENLVLAMKVAEESLDLLPMIDPDDMLSGMKPDERTVMTQVAQFYKVFASYNKGEVAAGKIATVLRMNQEHDKMQAEFETMASTLLEWIPGAVANLNARPVLVTVQDCLGTLQGFQPYRTVEYPAKLIEKGTLEAFHSSLQTKLKLSRRSEYVPPEGMMIEQIEARWGELHDADQTNKTWVLESLRRAKICAQKEQLFNTKCTIHETWCATKLPVLQAEDYAVADLGTLNAMLRKHEAFRSDLLAHETRVHDIGTLANELDDLQFVRANDVNTRYANIYEQWQQLIELTELRTKKLTEALETQQKVEQLWVDIATNAAPLNAFLDEIKGQLQEDVVADSHEDVQAVQAALVEIQANMEAFQTDFDTYMGFVAEAQALRPGDNPFALYTPEQIEALYSEVQGMIPGRNEAIAAEEHNQSLREELRKEWATACDGVNHWWTATSGELKGMSDVDAAGELEAQLSAAQLLQKQIEDYQGANFPALEALDKKLQEEIILENKHTNFTMEDLRGKVYQLITASQTLETDLGNQILLRDGNNISEEQMEEFRESFKHFDKDNSDCLESLEFRACLISLGFPDIPTVPNPAEDAEFDRITKRVDPNGDGKISFGEFVAFMSEERADVQEKDDFLEQLKVLAQGADYILPAQLAELPDDLRDYCLSSMPEAGHGPPGALDYQSFADVCYGDAEV